MALPRAYVARRRTPGESVRATDEHPATEERERPIQRHVEPANGAPLAEEASMPTPPDVASIVEAESAAPEAAETAPPTAPTAPAAPAAPARDVPQVPQVPHVEPAAPRLRIAEVPASVEDRLPLEPRDRTDRPAPAPSVHREAPPAPAADPSLNGSSPHSSAAGTAPANASDASAAMSAPAMSAPAADARPARPETQPRRPAPVPDDEDRVRLPHFLIGFVIGAIITGLVLVFGR
jgi:translation initiation factor IF-2